MLLYKILYTKLGSYSEVARFFQKHPSAALKGNKKIELYVEQIDSLRNMCREVGEKTGIKMFKTL
jgi:hypothetical protein